MKRRATLVLAVVGLIMAGCVPEATAEAGIAVSLATATSAQLPGPVTIQAGDCAITFLGDFEAVQGEKLVLRFQVDCGGTPGQGTFFATLGDPPSEAKATHGSGELDAAGEITIELDVNWDPGNTVLYCSYNGEVYQVVSDFSVK